MNTKSSITRRSFIQSTALASAALAAPNILTAAKGSKQWVVGEGAHAYEVQHDWVTLPDQFRWQTTHNVAFDNAGLLYVIHEGRQNQPDHPSIFFLVDNG
jgi:hypothetical protein